METKSKVWGILTGVLAIAAGILIISFEASVNWIMAVAAVTFGIVQIVKYVKADAQSRNIVVIVVGAILVIAGVVILVLPRATDSIFIFVQIAIGVWAAANGIIWLVKCFKHKDSTNSTVFMARLILCIAMLGFAITLLILAFAGEAAMMAADRVIAGCAVIVFGLAELFMLD